MCRLVNDCVYLWRPEQSVDGVLDSRHFEEYGDNSVALWRCESFVDGVVELWRCEESVDGVVELWHSQQCGLKKSQTDAARGAVPPSVD